METIEELRTRMDDETEARARACEFLAAEFQKAITGDLNAPCVLGPKWVTVRGRLPNAGDLLMDALDNKDFMERAVRVLVATARSQAVSTQREAGKLLDDVAQHWADQRADDYL